MKAHLMKDHPTKKTMNTAFLRKLSFAARGRIGSQRHGSTRRRSLALPARMALVALLMLCWIQLSAYLRDPKIGLPIPPNAGGIVDGSTEADEMNATDMGSRSTYRPPRKTHLISTETARLKVSSFSSVRRALRALASAGPGIWPALRDSGVEAADDHRLSLT